MATKYTLIDLGGGSGGGISGLTANTVPYALSSSSLASTSVTKTELEYVHGVTSSIQTQLDSKQSTSIQLSASLTYTANTTTTVSSSSLTAISGMIAQNVSIPATADYLVILFAEQFQSTTGNKCGWGIDIDGNGGTAFPQVWNMGSDLDRKCVTVMTKMTLTAGTRAIKPMMKRVSGSGNLTVDTNDSSWVITITSV